MVCLLFAFTAMLTVTVVDSFDSFLAQGRSDTLRTLKRLIKDRQYQISPFDSLKVERKIAWDPEAKSFEDPLRLKHFKTSHRHRRHISRAVIESGDCEHVDLIDCSDFATDEMTCMITATGMPCCVCTGHLKAAKRGIF